jgi:hypothetical protein
MSDFNLRSVVRQVARNSTLRDPRQLADEVLRRIPQEELLNVLRDALLPLVREVVSADRPHGVHTTGPGRSQKHSAIGQPSAGSWKVGAIRDGWQEHLRARYSTEGGVYKFLGECTYEDLQFIAGRLDHQAETYRSKAAGMRVLASMLTDHEVATVRDLPAERLMVALGAAA